jgi:hypothetical protein
MNNCARCKVSKSRKCFYVYPDGRVHSYCRDCVRVYTKEPKRAASRLAYATKYHKENTEQRTQYKRNRRTTVEGRALDLMDRARIRAAESGKGFDLTRPWVEKLISGRCAVSGREFDLTPSASTHANPNAPSLDRIDSTKGYLKSNVRAVTVHVNYALNLFGDDALVSLAKDVLRTISSRASPKGVEGSTTIPKGSRTKRSEAPSTLQQTG